MSSYVWEISVCLIESLLFTYLFYQKIGFKPNRPTRALLSILFSSAILISLTLFHVPLFPKMLSMLLVYMLLAFFAFDCLQQGKRYKAVLWSSLTLIIVTVSDFITYSIAFAVLDYPSEQLLQFTSARIQFSVIYLLLIAFMVWGLTHLGELDPQLPIAVSIVLFLLVGIGIFSAESMIDIALALGRDPATTKQANTLTILGYSILLMLFALLITFEYLGVLLRRNRTLTFQYQLAQMEEQQYQFVVSTAESLAQWKHDYKAQLQLISALIEDENYTELAQFATKTDAELGASERFLLTGNRTMDAVISLRLMDAKRHNIPLETKLYLPEELPLEAVSFSALIGNILDNAIEACQKLDAPTKHIYFEMKPVKRMLYLVCTNTSDGNYVRGVGETLLSTKTAKGHGIGLRRIRELVEAAGGVCQFSPEEHQFSVRIMLPLKEKNDEPCHSRKRSPARPASANAAAAMVEGATNPP